MVRFVFSLIATLCLALPAQALDLAPYKDRLFAYPALLDGSDPPVYRIVDYREMRDINGRDAVPERRVRDDYVSLGIARQRADLVLDTGGFRVRHIATGKRDGASLIVIYLHGQGGNRKQGVSDYTFGGNFNRAQNLVAAAGGLYLSPDFSDFGARGAAEITALAQHYLSVSPGARLFLACGSMGGQLCWRLAGDKEVVRHLGGMLLMGSMWDESYLTGPGFTARVPLYFGQGSRDPVFPVERQEAFFRSILKAAPDYPARFVRFETGTHGTPIRMTDWRETLNWMLQR
ncbi:phospholipase [Zhengella mangrovi]|uniref:Phospholipase n=1 Tax=Zhengella mangrovi TaxID=1982044 RepID=A0A2G1QM98_9HYPH|nr:phospholipase [Zhengella mangrovi]PHP66657.1 phospholipase [Zhengella mangrovi]